MKKDVLIKKVNKNAKELRYSHKNDAGFDFAACHNALIPPKETVIIKTGWKMAIPEGYEIQIRPRSGLSLKSPLRIANSPGTIDSGYRGEVGILLWNSADYKMRINKGDRVAQGVLKEVPQANFKVVEELSESERGSGGYGSTGLNEDS